MAGCGVKECERPHQAKGYCSRHYHSHHRIRTDIHTPRDFDIDDYWAWVKQELKLTV